MHPAIKYTVEKPEIIQKDGKLIQRLVFLSLKLHMDNDGIIWTDVFYKPTNTQLPESSPKSRERQHPLLSG